MTPRALASLAGLVLAAAVAGCAAPGAREAKGVADDQGRLVARDFVAALASLRGYDPRNTTVQMRSARSPFGESLADELRRAGYGMQLVADDESAPLLVTWESDAFENASGRSVGYRLRVGAVELGREYELRAGRVFPMTALSVRGVPIGQEPLDGGIFDRNRRQLEATGPAPSNGGVVGPSAALPSPASRERRGGAPLAPAMSGDAAWRPLSSGSERLGDPSTAGELPGPTGDGGGSPTRTIADNAFGTRVRAVIGAPVPAGADDAPATGDADGDTRTARAAPATGSGTAGPATPSIAARVQRNVLEIGRSNFAPLLAGRDVAEEHVLVFANDSLRLGEDNKAVLNALATRFDPDEDLVAVLGCSHGPTTIEGGNELLATGRAHRVKEALVRAGIPAGAVLDEGCWASTAQPDLPARAVVVARRTRGPDGRRS